jgi:preprotein translocase subunit SecE
VGRQYLTAIVSGPVTDIRDEHIPPKGTAVSVSSLEIGRGNDYWIKRMAKVSPFKFLQEVRAEAQKVTWPTRKETTVTTIMVFVMVFIASIFFLLADQVMRIAVSFLLGINS